LETHPQLSVSAQSILCNALSYDHAIHIHYINGGILMNDNQLNNDIMHWLQKPEYVAWQRQILDIFQRMQPSNTNPDTTAMVLDISEVLTASISKQHVIDFINSLKGWAELC